MLPSTVCHQGDGAMKSLGEGAKFPLEQFLFREVWGNGGDMVAQKKYEETHNEYFGGIFWSLKHKFP